MYTKGRYGHEGRCWVQQMTPYLPCAEAHIALGAEQGNAGRWHLEHIPPGALILCATDGRDKASLTNIGVSVTKEL